MADRSQQTEKATPRRMEKARREGQFPVAREFVASLQFLVFVLIATSYAASVWAGAAGMLRRFLGAAFTLQLTPAGVAGLAGEMAMRVALPLLAGGGVLVVVTLGAQLGVTRMGFATKKLAPDFKRLSPGRKLAEMPRQNIPQLFQALLLIPLFLVVVYGIASERWNQFLRLPLAGAPAGLRELAGSLETLLWRACLLFLVLGGIDLFRQRRRHERDLMMSKQEIREEAKENEGNPQVKGRIRRLQRDLLRRRMMSEVPRATAVIVNPTHYAVAIRYQAQAMAAPLVVAKGKNYLALRIRQKAIENQVPIVENPPLAQSLYKAVDVGQEIPPALYRAVAEVLAYIYRLTHGRRG
jgi:flagellar biosynthesis protein FlhB